MAIVGRRREPALFPSERDIAQYRERGFWIAPKLLGDEQIERLNRAHERIWAGELDGDGFYYEGKRPEVDPHSPAVRKVQNGWWINDEVRALVTSTVIGEVARALLGATACRLWHDQVIEKPGSAGGEQAAAGNVGWHQDYAYWQCTTTTNMTSAWVALQDTDLANGALMTLVGSHRWGLVHGSATFTEHNLDDLRARFGRMPGKEWIEEPCIMKAGQVSFHHALCFHASGPNRTPRPRRCVTAHIMPDGTAFQPDVQFEYRPGVPYHTNVRFLGPRPFSGQKFDNQYFPLLDNPAYAREARR